MSDTLYTDALYAKGLADAAKLQQESAGMTGTELYDAAACIPDFVAAVKVTNMQNRLAGFICRSSAGRVVKLIVPYNSDTYPEEPEVYPALWTPYWSKNPAHAVEFMAISTSPYMVGDCCSVDGIVYCSLEDNNVWSPADQPQRWEQVEV